MLMRLHNRKDFLKLLGAAGIGAAAGASVLPGAVRTQLQPTAFSFAVREQFRPFHLLAKNFVQLDNSFNGDTTGDYTILRPGPSEEDDGFVRAGDGKMRFAGQDDYYTILKSDTEQEAPFATVIIDVASQYIERLGYGTHGDFYVMQAEQKVRGWEFSRRNP
jgi:hypothetical protein